METETLEFVEATSEPMSVEPYPVRARPSRPAATVSARIPHSFAGFRLTTLTLVAAIAGLLVWNVWITREVVGLKRHRIVSVSLASIIADFVRDQAHAQGTPDEAATRTKLYLVATQKALIDLARNGTPVVASEAVLGNSVPDDTAAVKAAVARAVAGEPGQR